LTRLNAKNPRMQDSFNFGIDLVMALVRPFIEMRPRIGTISEI